MKKIIRRVITLLKLSAYEKDAKVFCISMQRTGTTSVGKFFRDFGFRWAGWGADRRNKWSVSWCDGDYDKIFSSLDFRAANAFEDSPWFMPNFYETLYQRFPNSKFILFHRDPDAWFKSMLKHSGGNVIGWGRVHCKIYGREQEYLELLESGQIDEQNENQISSEKTMKLEGWEDHYKAVYLRHKFEAEEFFNRHAPQALFVGSLEDPDKWIKLGEFLNIEVPPDYNSHENKSDRK